MRVSRQSDDLSVDILEADGPVPDDCSKTSICGHARLPRMLYANS